MDALREVKQKVANSELASVGRGLESVVKHIEIGERYYIRAKTERDENLFTDVIYRTNHAFEGILKEAYVVLANEPVGRRTPYEIEEYLLRNNVLRGRVVDLLTNYRQDWRNPSTHDYQLFFSEQEAFLAIMSVTAFVSILVDQIIEKVTFVRKLKELGNAALIAREGIKDFDQLSPLDQLYRILISYATYYLDNFKEMSRKTRVAANAEMGAFIKSAGPGWDVSLDVERKSKEKVVRLDLLVNISGTDIGVETRDPRTPDEDFIGDRAAANQLAEHLRIIGFTEGVVFFYPGRADDIAVGTHDSSSWPQGMKLREIYSDRDYHFSDDDEPEESVDP